MVNKLGLYIGSTKYKVMLGNNKSSFFGNTIVWNQLVKPINISQKTNYGVTYSTVNGCILIETVQTGLDESAPTLSNGAVNISNNYYTDKALGYSQITGHKYYSPKTLPDGFSLYSNLFSGGVTLCSGYISTGKTTSGSNGQYWLIAGTKGSVVSPQQTCPVMLFDLTLMFGAGNEPTKQEFEAMFPMDVAYPYNVGELIYL